MPSVESFLAWRFLFNREHKRLVSVITMISIAGVTVGVAALIIVIGIIEGIDRDIFSKIVEIQPHLKISQRSDMDEATLDAALQKVKGHAGVRLAALVVQKQVLFERGVGENVSRMPAQLIAVDRIGPNELYPIPISTGTTLELEGREVLLGFPLLYHLNARGGDEVLARTGIVQRTPQGRIPRTRRLLIIGQFGTGLWEFDTVTGFISRSAARELFGADRAFDEIHVKARDPFAVGKLRSDLSSELGDDFGIVTWEDENGEFFQALKLEKLGLVVILLLVVIVASFNIIGTLILNVMEKTRQIGMLKAMGTSRGMIRKTFVYSGTIIGLIGGISGLVLGLFGCYAIQNWVRFSVPPSIYNMDRLPVLVKPLTVACIVGASMAISLVASLFPAAQAARLDPVEALRHD